MRTTTDGLAADASVRLPAIFAASEYLQPIHVETSEERPPAPVVIAPFPGDESIEERLFTERDADEQRPFTMLTELVDEGLIEESAATGVQEAPRDFRAILDRWRPAGVLAVGTGARLRALQRESEEYHATGAGGDSRLIRLDVGFRAALRDQWLGIEERVERFRRYPPQFEGEPVGERFRNDALAHIAFLAAEEAALALAVEDVVAELLGDTGSIVPDERVRG